MKSNRLGMYADVRDVLDSALSHGGGEYQLSTHGMAVHWRQRAYQFRKLYAQSLHAAVSPYDRLTLPRIEDASSTVILRLISAAGVFKPAREKMEDELLDVAEALAAKIDGGELL